MEVVTLRSKTADGKLLEAKFVPSMGMNLISYQCGGIEVIDQSTKNLFEERYAGLGALIGPHFHRRNPNILPKIADKTKFPHIERVEKKGVADPFSHGIARYAPWKATFDESSIRATLSGKDEWNGVPIAQLEGQQFLMDFDAKLSSEGLALKISVRGDTDSLVGIHYYYRLPGGKGTVRSLAANKYRVEGESKPLPAAWRGKVEHSIELQLGNEEYDHGFFPFPDPAKCAIELETAEYTLRTKYRSKNQENSWQLFHPKGSSFVCVEPLSAQYPKRPILTVSTIEILLTVEPK
jgi:hypothetical protein